MEIVKWNVCLLVMWQGELEQDGSGGEHSAAHSCDGWRNLCGDDILPPVEAPTAVKQFPW